MALPTVTLTGTYVRPDGTPIRGWIDFCPPSVLTFSDEPTFVACCSRVRLDELGQFSVELVATDAEGSNVENWQYRVEENLDCPGGQRTYRIELGQDTPSIDLAQIAPTTRPPNLNYLRLPGPEGPEGPASENNGTVLSLISVAAGDNTPIPIPVEVDGIAHGVTVDQGQVQLINAGLWAYAATVLVDSLQEDSYTLTTWLEWEEDGQVKIGPEHQTTGFAGPNGGFDAYYEALLVVPTDTTLQLYASVDNTTGNQVSLSGRAAVGALLIRPES